MVAKGCVRFGLAWSGQYIKMAMERWIFKYHLSHCYLSQLPSPNEGLVSREDKVLKFNNLRCMPFDWK